MHIYCKPKDLWKTLPLKLMIGVARIFEALEVFRIGATSNWFGLACPHHCYPNSLSIAALLHPWTLLWNFPVPWGRLLYLWLVKAVQTAATRCVRRRFLQFLTFWSGLVLCSEEAGCLLRREQRELGRPVGGLASPFKGRVPKPRPSRPIDLANSIHVILRAEGHQCPLATKTSDYRYLVKDFTEESISHGFASQAEAKAYCLGAGVEYPQTVFRWTGQRWTPFKMESRSSTFSPGQLFLEEEKNLIPDWNFDLTPLPPIERRAIKTQTLQGLTELLKTCIQLKRFATTTENWEILTRATRSDKCDQPIIDIAMMGTRTPPNQLGTKEVRATLSKIQCSHDEPHDPPFSNSSPPRSPQLFTSTTPNITKR